MVILQNQASGLTWNLIVLSMRSSNRKILSFWYFFLFLEGKFGFRPFDYGVVKSHYLTSLSFKNSLISLCSIISNQGFLAIVGFVTLIWEAWIWFLRVFIFLVKLTCINTNQNSCYHFSDSWEPHVVYHEPYDGLNLQMNSAREARIGQVPINNMFFAIPSSNRLPGQQQHGPRTEGHATGNQN